MGGGSIDEVERPRSAWQLIGATFALYRRFPWLFLVLAAVVVIPYNVLDLLGGPDGPLHGAALAIVGFALFIGDFALVLPLISALHVHAIDDVRQGREPVLGSVARRGLRTLPVWSPAALISWLGIFAGFVALIVPGVLLLLRWSVVAQAATLDSARWRDALDRSRLLTSNQYGHVLALSLMLLVIDEVPSIPVDFAFGLGKTTVVSFLLRTAISVVTSSFSALAIGLLYFDLTARFREEGREFTGSRRGPELGDPLTPFAYTDENRPHGWYVDPEQPRRMRYWAAGDKPVWSQRSTKTPGQTLVEWHNFTARHEQPADLEPDGGGQPAVPTLEPSGHPLDPASYKDDDRPPGWYVNPDAPWRMRYWAADGKPGWSKRTAKTPKETLAEWRDLRGKR
jgi:hypothetical protein